jgi:hypothetical protein
VWDLARHADPDRQVRAAPAYLSDPAGDHVGVEAELADDVGRHRRLGEHRADRLLVADQVVALRIAGDADPVEVRAPGPHRLEQLRRARELAGRVGGVAGEHEQLAHAAGVQPLEQLGQVSAIAHQPRRDVRDGGVAGAGEPLGQLERGVQALARGGSDGDLHVGSEVSQDLFLDALQRQHLEARAAQQVRQARRLRVRASW